MNVEQVGGSRIGAGATFNVLWPGGEAAAASTRETVLEAAALLRRLGTDVRMRMPQPGTPEADANHRWADTVLLVDDAHDPAALATQVHAAAAAAPHVVVCTTGRDWDLAGDAPSAQIAVLNRPDGAALAAAWLPLTERDAPAGAAWTDRGLDRSRRPRRLFRPAPAGSGASGEHEGHGQPGDDAGDHADGRVTQQ